MAAIDFVLEPTTGVICAIGWRRVDDPQTPELRCGEVVVQPIRQASHRREDMPPTEALGWIWVFEGAAPGAQVTLGDRATSVCPDGQETFAKAAVDGAFFALLWAMACGDVTAFDTALPPCLRARLADRLASNEETSAGALGLEAADFSDELGLGLLQVWSLEARCNSTEIAALTIGPLGAAPLSFGDERYDTGHLRGYSERFRVSGIDGRIATFTPSDLGGVEQLLVLQRASDGRFIGLAIRSVPRPMPRMALLALDCEKRVRSTGRSILAQLPLPEGCPQLAEAAIPTTEAMLTGVRDGPLHIILEHDCSALAIRDVVRRLARNTRPPVMLHIVEGAGPPQLGIHLDIALREVLGRGFTCGAPVVSGNWKSVLPKDGIVLSGRSSALLQLNNWPELPARMAATSGVAAISVFAPDARAVGGRGRQALSLSLCNTEVGLTFCARIAALRSATQEGGIHMASLDGDLRHRLMCLIDAGAPVSLEPDDAGMVMPGYDLAPAAAAYSARAFDAVRLAAAGGRG